MVLYTPSTGEVAARRDFKTLGEVARAIMDLGRHATFGVMEFVSARPGQGVCSMFSFGRSTGVAIGALEALGLPYCDVTPQKWQAWVRRFAGLDAKESFVSPQMAQQLALEGYSSLFSRKKDHNTADAFLMALWASYEALDGVENAGKDDDRRLPPVQVLLEQQKTRP